VTDEQRIRAATVRVECKGWLSVADFALLASKSTRTVNRWLASGAIPREKTRLIGGSRLIHSSLLSLDVPD